MGSGVVGTVGSVTGVGVGITGSGIGAGVGSGMVGITGAVGSVIGGGGVCAPGIPGFGFCVGWLLSML